MWHRAKFDKKGHGRECGVNDRECGVTAERAVIYLSSHLLVSVNFLVRAARFGEVQKPKSIFYFASSSAVAVPSSLVDILVLLVVSGFQSPCWRIW